MKTKKLFFLILLASALTAGNFANAQTSSKREIKKTAKIKRKMTDAYYTILYKNYDISDYRNLGMEYDANDTTEINQLYEIIHKSYPFRFVTYFGKNTSDERIAIFYRDLLIFSNLIEYEFIDFKPFTDKKIRNNSFSYTMKIYNETGEMVVDLYEVLKYYERLDKYLSKHKKNR